MNGHARELRLRTDGLHWRVEVRASVRDWPRFWRSRDEWRPCNLSALPGFPLYATTNEATARAAYTRIERFEEALAAGYRTVSRKAEGR